MCISGTEPSSLILSQTKLFQTLGLQLPWPQTFALCVYKYLWSTIFDIHKVAEIQTRVVYSDSCTILDLI